MKVRFLDSSVFLHAYLKPRRELTPRELAIKSAAKEIIERVESGEPVVTTVIHISEVANIVEARVGLAKSIGLISRLLVLSNVNILGVSAEDYEEAVSVAQEYGVSVNDAIAYVKMGEEGIREIYTFDKHFKNLPEIVTLP